MAKKIVFIGSGSLVFTRNLVRDLLTFDAFRDAEIALVDINETNLALSKKAVTRRSSAGSRLRSSPASGTMNSSAAEKTPSASAGRPESDC